MTREALEIPEAIRFEVYTRDGLTCRLCGKYLGERAGIHHIDFGAGVGRRRVHDVDAMCVICWLPGDPARKGPSCHTRAHSNKDLWRELLLTAVSTPGVTALQLRRWDAASARRTTLAG